MRGAVLPDTPPAYKLYFKFGLVVYGAQLGVMTQKE